MQNTTNIECSSCGADVVPRLVHHDVNNFMAKRKTEHICPICGVTMYKTGGGLTPLGKVWITILTIISLSGLLSITGTVLPYNVVVTFVLSFIGGMVFIKIMRKKFKARRDFE